MTDDSLVGTKIGSQKKGAGFSGLTGFPDGTIFACPHVHPSSASAVECAQKASDEYARLSGKVNVWEDVN